MSTTVPTSMRALMLVERVQSFAQANLAACFEVQNVPVPVPQPHEVLVKVAASPINPSNFSQLQGYYGNFGNMPLPQVTGVEGSGVVVAAGSDAHSSLVGKRVGTIVDPAGMWAEYVAVPAVSLIELPANATFEDGASCFINPLTAVAFVEIAIARKVKTIIHTAGASALGKMLVRHAKEFGVNVIAVVRRQEHVDTLCAEGADYIVNTSDDDWQKQLQKLATELEATIGFDAVAGATSGAILSAMPPKSELFVYGALSGEAASGVSALDLIFQGKSLNGFWIEQYLANRGAGVAEMTAKVANGLLTTFKTNVRVSYPLEEAAAALLDYAGNMSNDKVIFKP
ncbi:zinc-binding dehydrogenase family protein [Achlya hypogyna]|uniref:Zinc-binding dehydrogenase family protein n=1 Tax=Achlya hypogyna TaxID=1202772 RepID=A0A1V9YQD1_ACHHY|nr:zinc-binding dehydrogenase family protein [Achlya hypogyna]